jgi:hypothetical protein
VIFIIFLDKKKKELETKAALSSGALLHGTAYLSNKLMPHIH